MQKSLWKLNPFCSCFHNIEALCAEDWMSSYAGSYFSVQSVVCYKYKPLTNEVEVFSFT